MVNVDLENLGLTEAIHSQSVFNQIQFKKEPQLVFALVHHNFIPIGYNHFLHEGVNVSQRPQRDLTDYEKGNYFSTGLVLFQKEKDAKEYLSFINNVVKPGLLAMVTLIVSYEDVIAVGNIKVDLPNVDYQSRWVFYQAILAHRAFLADAQIQEAKRYFDYFHSNEFNVLRKCAEMMA